MGKSEDFGEQNNKQTNIFGKSKYFGKQTNKQFGKK